MQKLRMNDQPSTSVHVLISDSLGFSIKFEFEVTGREDVKCGWGSVLNDKGWLLSFGDDSAESGEWFGDSFWVMAEIR